MNKTTKNTINNIIWKACDTFRGTMDSSQYKDYVLTMLFVKYLSDFYKEKKEELIKKYDGKMDRVAKQLSREKFTLDETCTFEYLYENKNRENIGEIINSALERIEEDNKGKLEGVFRNIDFNSEAQLGRAKERNSMLKHLLEDFNSAELDLRPSMLEGNDVIGDSYEYLIANFAGDAGKKGGEFFTPTGVSTLLAKLAGAKDGDRIYDPTCGSGSLLIKASKEVGSKNFQIYGQERNGQTQSLCKMNMFLHDINDSKIQWGDTIRNPLLVENDKIMKFDVVLANPPFSLEKWGEEEAKSDKYNRFIYGIPPKSKGDYAFVQHMIASMNSEGTVAVVVPHGVLFRGASEGKIREGIIKANLLDAVIGLPANLFFGTPITACILIFKNNKNNNNILFIDASKEFAKEKNQNILRDKYIEKIVKTYAERKEVKKYAHIATMQEIAENNYNLNIPRYVETFEEEKTIDLGKIVKEMKSLEAEIKATDEEIKKYCDKLGIETPIF